MANWAYTNKKFGKLIRHRRKILGLTQKHVAGRIGISRRSLIKAENGGRICVPSPKKMFLLSSTLGIPVSMMLDVVGYKDPGDKVLELPKKAGWLRLLFYKLTKRR